MRIRELFVADVTRDIPPVVYFHEQSPPKLASEVAEYIITGGYPETDPRWKRTKNGIHEQFVHLLRAISNELAKPGGPALPASWISGFYGSGKSSFAKLLGLALDGATLPDGRTLAAALLARDDAPRRQELVEAWDALVAKVKPLAVVFDIGGVARDDEHIHAAVLRQVQIRLGYCPKSNLVADYELKLQRDEEWDRFLATAERVLGKPWSQAMKEEQADDHFSHVLHALFPERYRDPTSWIDSRAGSRTGAGTSVREAVEAIEAMLSINEEESTLFLVVDEVSQYVHQDENRMLKLQSFVSELGQRLKGRVWLFATGQQKLEDGGEANNIGKLKDRFPPSLRVHLATTNIRDVVHKRLLRKKTEQEATLRELFQRHRGDLKLHGYGCEEITEEDFVEVYPLLPGHVDLLMQITSNLRTRSTRVQGDDHAIRGLLQLLGELFREQKLAERPVGDLVTLDAMFEVQHSALDADVQTTLARIFDHADVREDATALRVAKAVALLELIQEQTPTTAELVSKCLYARLGEGNRVQAVSQALEKLRAANLVAYSEKHGYKVQSSAGQEWQRQRDDVGVTAEQISGLVQRRLEALLGQPERARFKGRPFAYAAFFSDGRQAKDARIGQAATDSPVTIDFQFLKRKDDRSPTAWTQRSDQEALRDRIVWVVGDTSAIDDVAGELVKSERMVKRHEDRRASLTMEQQRLLIEEQTRQEELDKRVRLAVAEAFLDGTIYFRGRAIEPRDLGSSFATVVNRVAEQTLPALYPYFTDIAVTETELAQLLEPVLSGPSTKFLEGALGILSLDGGRYLPTCSGDVPARILQFVEQSGASGATIIAHFARPPYGYPLDVVRACLVGLLRAEKIRIQPEEGSVISSVRDPGAKDLFRRERDLRRADVVLAKENAISARDKVAICTFFKERLDIDLDRENDAIADAVFAHFPGVRDRLRKIEGLFDQLPGRPELPETLKKLAKALEDGRRSREIEPTVKAVKRHLDALRDGVEQLGMLQTDLTEDAIRAVREAADVRDHQIAQLRHAGELGGAEADAEAVEKQLRYDRPWRDARSVATQVSAIRELYVEKRRALLNRQNAEAEAVRKRVKTRPNFEKLDADQAHQVLRPIAEALVDTSPEAVSPTLVELRDRFPTRLAEAEDRANERLDEVLSAGTTAPVVRVDAQVRGREIASRQQLDALLRELEERIGPMVADGKRVRLV